MTSTFVNDLRLNEMATGDQSGSWGTVTNTNLELIGEALGYGTEGITTNANTHTSTIADGATDPVRALYVEYTGTLDSACTITIAPNTVNKVCFIENGTSGSQNIIIKQGSGATITIPAGQTKAVYLDGAGSGAKVVDAFASLSVVDLIVSDDLVVGDDLGVTGLATIGETLAVTGVLTTTAAAVFNGGFASNDGSTISTADNTTQLTLISTDADANSGPNLDFYRNSASPADGDSIGVFQFIGRNDNSQDVTAIQIETKMTDVSDGDEDASFSMGIRRAGAFIDALSFDPTETVFNDSGADVDFRVASDTKTHMLFIDSGGNGVAIGTDTVDGGPLTVSTGNTHPTAATFQSTGTTQLFLKDTDAASNNKYWGFQVSGGSLNIITCDDNKAGGFVTPLELTQTDVKLGTGADFITNTGGSNNVRLGVNAGDALNGGNQNVCIGDEAGTGITDGGNNIAIGYRALQIEDSNGNNVAIGTDALKTLNAGASGFNTAVGHEAGTLIDLGIHNTLIGGRAGDKLAHSDFNVAVGVNALGADTLGFGSVAIGVSALQTMNFTSSTETRCTAVGFQAGKLNQTGTDNTLIGAQCGDALTTGFQNTGVGHDALGASDDGQNNVAVGFLALNGNCGDNNTAVGESALAVSTGTNNQCFGNSAGAAITGGNYNTIVGNHTGNGDSVDIRGADNNLIIADGQGNVRISYRSDGNTFQIPDLYSNTSSGSANMVALASGTIARATSSLRYKKDVADATHGLSEVLNLRPVTYKGKGGEDGDTVYGGLIAEEVHAAGLTEFVEYDTQDRPDALHYSNMVSLCIKAIQEQQATITALTDRIAVLEG